MNKEKITLFNKWCRKNCVFVCTKNKFQALPLITHKLKPKRKTQKLHVKYTSIKLLGERKKDTEEKFSALITSPPWKNCFGNPSWMSIPL